MIDFRYLLIAIIAIFLALGIGIVMGSGLIGGEVVQGLRGQARDLFAENDDLRRQIIQLEDREEDNNTFLSAVEPLLVDGELIGEEIVVFEIEGTEGELFESLQQVVEEADGEIATRIEIRNRLALEEEGSVDELAGAIGADGTDPEDLRVDLAALLGAELGAEASGRNLGPRDTSSEEVEALVADLADAGFLSLESFGDRLVPPGSSFVIVGGSPEAAPFATEDPVRALSMSLDEQGRRVLVAETSDSVWELAGAVRSDDEVAAEVSTVDNAETIAGRINVALALGQSNLGGAMHLGIKSGAGPAPSPPG